MSVDIVDDRPCLLGKDRFGIPSDVRVALWGGSSIVRFAPDGRLERRVPLPARQPTCPAFGGDALSFLFVTTASQGVASPLEADGAILGIATGVAGCEKYPVKVE